MKVDAQYAPGEILDVIVRPRLNPVLSPYLAELTGITNEEVRARGVDFVDAYRESVTFAGGLPIIAYGRDELVLIDNLRLYGIENAPPLPPYINVIPWMGEQGVDVRGLHSCDVGPMAGVPFTGRKHNARYDALSVVAGVGALIARGAPAPQTA